MTQGLVHPSPKHWPEFFQTSETGLFELRSTRDLLNISTSYWNQVASYIKRHNDLNNYGLYGNKCEDVVGVGHVVLFFGDYAWQHPSTMGFEFHQRGRFLIPPVSGWNWSSQPYGDHMKVKPSHVSLVNVPPRLKSAGVKLLCDRFSSWQKSAGGSLNTQLQPPIWVLLFNHPSPEKNDLHRGIATIQSVEVIHLVVI